MAFGRELPDTLAEAITLARQLLSNRRDLVERGVVETEAEQIVMAAAGLRSRIDLFVQARDRLSEELAQKVLVMAMGRSEGRILQHLTGFQDFLDHRYKVSADVLVPRPETEILVTAAIERLQELGPSVGIEIGLGSGAISVELLARFPKLKMIASEISPAAESIARENAEKILGTGKDGAERLAVRRARDPLHVWEAFGANDHGQFLVSNPPYLAKGDPIDAEVEAHEPAAALFAAGSDPLHFYRKIAEKGAKRLLKGAHAFIEMPSFRSVAIARLFVDNGWEIEILKDLANRDRVLVGRLAHRGEDDDAAGNPGLGQ